MKIQTKWTHMPLGLVAASALLAGCVSQGALQTVEQERDAARTEQQKLATELRTVKAESAQREAELQKDRDRILRHMSKSEQQKRELFYEAEQAKLDVARTQELYKGLQERFSDELATKQVEVKLMESGVTVHLAEDILFPSGSADLSGSGKKVIARVTNELKDTPLQTIVAGFTDNLPIKGSLALKYPTNWELAGARAASVVRVMHEEGLSKEQLIAVSFGENNPVSGNDTPEGRAKNRRIEIRLRPVIVAEGAQ